MALSWSVVTEASAEDLAIVSSGVFTHGRALARDGNAQPIACLVREGGHVVAGGSGRTEYERLFVSYLWVTERLRCKGIGHQVLAELEAQAARRGCKDALIETLSDRVAEFYARCGYAPVASVSRYVGPFTKHILVKTPLSAQRKNGDA